MYRYIIKRLLLMIPVVIGVSIVIFVLISLTPGDPASMIIGGQGVSREELDKLNRELGYDLPLMQRYFKYMHGVITRFDFGFSYRTSLSVREDLLSRIPVSVTLAFSAIMFSIIVGTPIGIISVVKQYSLWDYIPTFIAMFLASAPAFWIGLMLMLFFSLYLGLLPTGGIESWKSYILPMLTLGLIYSAQQLRFTRSSMLETIRQDYIRTARAKGVRERNVIYKHALQNALLPVITIAGVNFGGLLGSAVVTETLFSIPGLGTYIVNGIRQKDIPVIMGGTICLSVLFSLLMLLVDLIYAYVDPRIKAKYVGKD